VSGISEEVNNEWSGVWWKATVDEKRAALLFEAPASAGLRETPDPGE